MKTSKIVLTIIAAMLAVGLVGCKKKEQPAAEPNVILKEETQKQAAKTTEDVKKTAAEAASIEQTMCPIMDGNKIDKNVFVEYKGKKVYFCCAGCKEEFEKDPEKYVAKLPQFAK
jgi:YHS domain-containing protein